MMACAASFYESCSKILAPLLFCNLSGLLDRKVEQGKFRLRF